MKSNRHRHRPKRCWTILGRLAGSTVRQPLLQPRGSLAAEFSPKLWDTADHTPTLYATHPWRASASGKRLAGSSDARKKFYHRVRDRAD